MKNFEKYAKSQLDNHASQVDVERLWANIDADLRPAKRRLPPVFWWSAASLAAVAVAAFFLFENGKLGGASQNSLDLAATALPAGDAQNFAAAKPAEISQPIENQKSIEQNSTFEQPKFSAKSGSSGKLPASPKAAAAADFSQILKIENQPASQPTAAQLAENQNPKSQTENLAAAFAAAEKLPNGLKFLEKPKRPDPKVGCYNFGRGKRGGGGNFHFAPYFGIYGGAQLPLKSLKTNNSEFQNLLTEREATEKVLEGVQIGGYVGSRIAGGIFGEVGLEYNRINERFQTITTRRDTVGQIATVGYFVNAPGDTTFFKDTINIVETTRTTKRTYNNYRTLQLPIAFGYEWNNGGRWTTYLKLGAMLNLSFGQKAEIINLAGDPQLYKSENETAEHPFRSKIGVSPFVNVGTRFGLTEQLSVFGELRYLQPLSKFTADGYPIEQKYALPGANLGLHFQF